LSAALVLGRARRRTLVIDAGEPSNHVAPAIGGLLGHDQRPPAELYAKGRSELTAYSTVEYRTGRVNSGAPAGDQLHLELDGGEQVTARRVLLATGMRYCPPPITGIDDLWGKSVFHCPFCHGWEMRDKRLAALAAGDDAVHSALMLRGWSDDVVLLTGGAPNLSAKDRGRLEAMKVHIDDRQVIELRGDDGQLTSVAFADGACLELDGLLVDAPLRQRSHLAERLGAACTAGPLAPDSIKVDELHRTTVPTVFAAGDICTEHTHVAGAIAAGSEAAMIIVQSLLAEQCGLPYPPGAED
jgi:thioredoxin reductase